MNSTGGSRISDDNASSAKNERRLFIALVCIKVFLIVFNYFSLFVHIVYLDDSIFYGSTYPRLGMQQQFLIEVSYFYAIKNFS